MSQNSTKILATKKMAGPTDSAQHFLHARHFNPKPFETQSKNKSTPDFDQLHTTQSYQRFQKMITVNMPGCTILHQQIQILKVCIESFPNPVLECLYDLWL